MNPTSQKKNLSPLLCAELYCILYVRSCSSISIGFHHGEGQGTRSCASEPCTALHHESSNCAWAWGSDLTVWILLFSSFLVERQNSWHYQLWNIAQVLKQQSSASPFVRHQQVWSLIFLFSVLKATSSASLLVSGVLGHLCLRLYNSCFSF